MATATKTRPGTKPSGRAAREAAAKEKAARAKAKEREARQKEKDQAAKRKEKEQAAKRKEKEQAAKRKEKEQAAKAKEKAAKVKAKEKAAKAAKAEKAAKAKKAKAKQTVKKLGTPPAPDAVVPEPVETTETPAAETPDTETPAAETPDTETPETETPAAETPDTETPLLPTVPANDKTVRPKGFIAESLGKEDAVDRSTQRATLAASYTTRDHDVIKAWAQTRNGRPADVAGTAGRRRGRGTAGVLRIEFPDGPGDDGNLEAVDWSAFFGTFDESDVDFLYQERVRTGDVSRFHKFVRAAG